MLRSVPGSKRFSSLGELSDQMVDGAVVADWGGTSSSKPSLMRLDVELGKLFSVLRRVCNTEYSSKERVFGWKGRMEDGSG